MGYKMANDELRDNRDIIEKTKAEILAGGIKAGMYWMASDTKELVRRSVDGLTYDEIVGASSTLGTTVSDVSNESYYGNKVNQSEVNVATVAGFHAVEDAILVNRDAIASMAGTSAGVDWDYQNRIPETMASGVHTTYTIEADSGDTTILVLNGGTDTFTLKKEIRYEYQTYLIIKTHSWADKVVTLTTRKVSDDSIILSRDVDVEGGSNKVHHLSIPLGIMDNTVVDNEVYVQLTANDNDCELLAGSTYILVNGVVTNPYDLQDITDKGSTTTNSMTVGNQLTVDGVTEKVYINPRGIEKDSGVGTPVVGLEINNPTTQKPDISLLTVNGIVEIDKPTTRETDTDNATRGASDPSALMSYGGAKQTDSIAKTAGTDVTIVADFSYENTTTVTLCYYLTLASNRPSGSVLLTVGTGHRPHLQQYVVFCKSDGSFGSCGRIHDTGEIKNSATLVTGDYTIQVTYSKN